MASVKSPRLSLSTIQREVSVVLRAAEDPAILTFKQVRVAVEKALGLKQGCLHKDYKPTIREAVHSVMDKLESESMAKNSSQPPRHAEPEPDETAATSTLKIASRGKKWNTRSSKKLKFEDPDEACRRDNTIPVPGKTETERQRGSEKKTGPEPESEQEPHGRTVKGKNEKERQRGPAKNTEQQPGRRLVKPKKETELQRGPAIKNEPEPEWRTSKGKKLKPERGSSGNRGGGGGSGSGSGSGGRGGGGTDRECPDGVLCVLSETKTSKKQVLVEKWKGNIRVDIREYYIKDTGELAPGLKGISLNPSQWEALKSSAEIVDEMVDELT